ncbi:hypothetical protein D1872_294240 [compost metagenome]
MLPDETYGVDAPDRHGVFGQSRNAEGLRLAAKSDHQIIIGQGPVLENNLFVRQTNFLNIRFDKVDLEFVDQLGDRNARMLDRIRPRGRHM